MILHIVCWTTYNVQNKVEFYKYDFHNEICTQFEGMHDIDGTWVTSQAKVFLDPQYFTKVFITLEIPTH